MPLPDGDVCRDRRHAPARRSAGLQGRCAAGRHDHVHPSRTSACAQPRPGQTQPFVGSAHERPFARQHRICAPCSFPVIACLQVFQIQRPPQRPQHPDIARSTGSQKAKVWHASRPERCCDLGRSLASQRLNQATDVSTGFEPTQRRGRDAAACTPRHLADVPRHTFGKYGLINAASNRSAMPLITCHCPNRRGNVEIGPRGRGERMLPRFRAAPGSPKTRANPDTEKRDQRRLI